MRAADASRLAQLARRPVGEVAAEQLGLGQFLRQRGAVDRDERRRAPPALAVQHMRDQFLARPRLALDRSEEHTSELQSLMRISYAVFCLKKKTKAMSKHM